MRKLTIKVTAETPICHSNVDANFDYSNERYKERKRLMAKGKNTTEADHERIADLNWALNLYQKKGKPLAMGRWVRKALIVAARTEKKGKKMIEAVFNVDDAELKLPKEKSLKELMKDSKYRWTRPVPRGVVVTNPIFPDSWFKTSIEFDETIIDEADVVRFLKRIRVGASITAGYGRVSVEVLKSEAV